MQLGAPLMLVRLFAVLFIGFFFQSVSAAERDTQQWTTLGMSFPVEDTKWSFGWWNQVRFNDDIGRFNWWLTNGSVHYKIADNWKLGAGYQYITKNKAGDETMPFQEISHAIKLDNSLVLGNRLRIEERDQKNVSGWVFRARYRLSAQYPLQDGYYLTGANALWVNLNEQDSGATSGFDQNRLFGGIGTHVGKRWRMEGGYQWRYKDNNRSGETNSDHIIMLQFFYSGQITDIFEPSANDAHYGL